MILPSRVDKKQAKWHNLLNSCLNIWPNEIKSVTSRRILETISNI
jgi:hypothetical protein